LISAKDTSIIALRFSSFSGDVATARSNAVAAAKMSGV
jgi:hypothetical protein